MHLFIDTNIFLSFYHLNSDDLEELKKLKALLQQNKVVLYITTQVIDEFKRNRESKIADGVKRLKDSYLKLEFPAFSKDYPEYEALKGLQKELGEKHKILMDKVNADAKNQRFIADDVINSLFAAATKIETNPIYNLAYRRLLTGNPPGKNGSLGDALNWECLLKDVPSEAVLYFITDDKDFCSHLGSGNDFNAFLLEEWQEKKKTSLVFYKKISYFFKDHFPTIKLASEIEKELAIQQLVNSSSFAETHIAIRQLSKYTGFSDAEKKELLNACITNSQIFSIRTDDDVEGFSQQLLPSGLLSLEEVYDQKLKEQIRPYLPQD